MRRRQRFHAGTETFDCYGFFGVSLRIVTPALKRPPSQAGFDLRFYPFVGHFL